MNLRYKYCDIKFTDQIVIEKHIKRVHRFTCEICSITYKDESQLKIHTNKIIMFKSHKLQPTPTLDQMLWLQFKYGSYIYVNKL